MDAALPRHLVAAGLLVWHPRGRLLLVKTVDRDALILPGGLVEEGESPARAASREAHEELGLAVEATALLAVQHLPALGDHPASLQLVFDSPPLKAEPALVLQPDEIEAAHWLSEPEAIERHGERGRARLAAALAARRRGGTAYLDG